MVWYCLIICAQKWSERDPRGTSKFNISASEGVSPTKIKNLLYDRKNSNQVFGNQYMSSFAEEFCILVCQTPFGSLSKSCQYASYTSLLKQNQLNICSYNFLEKILTGICSVGYFLKINL